VNVKVQLRDVAHARSGDKGNTSDIALFAWEDDWYPILAELVTAERVKEHYTGICHGEVTRYEVPNVHGLKFVLEDALGGGGPSSIRIDNLGKSLGAALLRMWIEVPDEIAPPLPHRDTPQPL
jgi:hypothetical protein